MVRSTSYHNNIHLNEKSLQIFKSIIDLANIMNIDVVTEGVEVIEQIQLIREYGETIIQGYYYCRPIFIDEFENKL